MQVAPPFDVSVIKVCSSGYNNNVKLYNIEH